MIEQDGYVTVHGTHDEAARVEANIAETLEGTLDAAHWPICVRICVDDYKALLARNGLEQRSIRVGLADQLRVRVGGFDLPVDADARVPADDAWIFSRVPETGRA